MRASAHLWLPLLLGVAYTLHACAEQQDAREITVHLFSTQPVSALSIDASRAATMKLCDGCKAVAVPPTLQMRRTQEGSQLTAGSKPFKQLLLSGELRVKTADGRTAAGAGRWVVKAERDGLHVLLTLPSERYVMSVLQAEAGPDDGTEALKALAVVARSFALTHSDRHGVEGLCDSTHCQASRMGAVPARIRDAVTRTAGETLWAGGRQVDGYFTENCGGEADDAAEVWGGGKKPWLRAHPDPYCQRQPAQWHASVTADELARSLITEGYRVPSAITGVRIVARDSGGRVAKIAVANGGLEIVLAASALRFAVNRELGWSRLRSDWYAVHWSGRDVLFDGRGYGHGVGLCQAGAAEMAHEGNRYREILAFYFAGAAVSIGSGDQGWREQQAMGWTLRSMSPDADLLQTGDEAWAHARRLWKAPTGVHPVVTIAPDTELFRQMTNQPGWTLASTEGQRITLQSSAVVKSHGPVRVLLLHEFLHAIVEGESKATTPLWLREGLVEVLSGQKASPQTLTVEQTEQQLDSAANLRQAQAAHAEAAALVQNLVAKYGLDRVRGWLSDGIPASVLSGQ